MTKNESYKREKDPFKCSVLDKYIISIFLFTRNEKIGQKEEEVLQFLKGIADREDLEVRSLTYSIPACG